MRKPTKPVKPTKQRIMYRRLSELTFQACKKDDKLLRQIIDLAMYWSNDLGDLVDEHFHLPHAPSEWQKLSKWQRLWNRQAKQILGW